MGPVISKLVVDKLAEAITKAVFDKADGVLADIPGVEETMKEISSTTKFIAKEMNIQTNLKYQSDFPRHTLEMLEHEMHATSNDSVPHYFTVYHPGGEHIPAVSNEARRRGMKGFAGCFDDLNKLAHMLLAIRRYAGPNAILHVLAPSAHRYRIQQTIHVPEEVLPLRLEGQTDRDGTPYVYVKLSVTGNFRCDGIAIYLRKHENVAANTAAVAAGTGAGLATIAGGVALLLTPAAPLALAAAASAPFVAAAAGIATKNKVRNDIISKKINYVDGQRVFQIEDKDSFREAEEDCTAEESQ